MSIRLVLVAYFFLVLLLLLFTTLAAVIIGVEVRLLARFVPLSNVQFAIFALLSTAMVAFFAVRMGFGLRAYIATLLLSPSLVMGLLGLAWGLQRIVPGLDLWTASLLIWGIAAALTYGFSDQVLDLGFPSLEGLEEWEGEEEWGEEEEEEYEPPPLRIRRLPRSGRPVRTQRVVTEEAEEEDEEDKWANVKRNDPCPCGSGKKYKNCHGRTKKQPR